MTTIPFEVVFVLSRSPTAVARMLESTSFRLVERATLDGVRIAVVTALGRSMRTANLGLTYSPSHFSPPGEASCLLRGFVSVTFMPPGG